MSLTTLTSLKSHTGIPATDTSQDTRLTNFMREASAAIRNDLVKYLGGLISVISVAASTVIESVGHQLVTGQTVLIGGSNSTPPIDGARVVTVIDQDHFSVPVTVTVAGSAGYYSPQITEITCGRGRPICRIQQRPVLSVSSVYLDDAAYFGSAPGAFAAATLLVAGTDYAADNPRGFLFKIGGSWPGVLQRDSSSLAYTTEPGLGNIKIVFYHGFAEGVPADLQYAANSLAVEMITSAAIGGALKGESVEGYSYTKATAEESAAMLSSISATLARYRTVTF